MFYRIFGQAYSRNYLDVDVYNKLCVNKDVRIRMPKMKIDEDTEIVAFSKEETERLDTQFQGTNAETAYLLGKCCGLRINECYSLKWENVDIENGRITIDLDRDIIIIPDNFFKKISEENKKLEKYGAKPVKAIERIKRSFEEAMKDTDNRLLTQTNAKTATRIRKPDKKDNNIDANTSASADTASAANNALTDKK